MEKKINLKLISGENIFEAEKIIPKHEGFPNYRIVKKWWKPFIKIKVEDGWENLGQKDSITQDGKVTITHHAFCNTRSFIGKEGGRLFQYCPRCLIKLEKP